MGAKKEIYTVLDIGSKNIKLIEAYLGNNTITVNKLSIIPMDTDASDLESEANFKNVVELINAEVNKKKFDKKRGIVLLSNNKVISREITMPIIPLKALDNTIKYEASQYFPINLDNYRIDYKIIDKIATEDSSKYRVYIVAVPENIIDLSVNVMEKSGINVEIVDIKSNALFKFIKFEDEVRVGNELSQEAFAILDIGASSTQIVFIDRGVFEFEKDIPNFNGNILTDMFSKYNGITNDQAESEKIKNIRKIIDMEDIDDQDEEQVIILDKPASEEEHKFRILAAEISKVLSDLISDINKVIEYHYSRGFKSLKKIYLTGGGALVDGLDNLLSENLNIEVSLLNNLQSVKNNDNSQVEQYYMYLANVLGGIIRTKEEEGK